MCVCVCVCNSTGGQILPDPHLLASKRWQSLFSGTLVNVARYTNSVVIQEMQVDENGCQVNLKVQNYD